MNGSTTYAFNGINYFAATAENGRFGLDSAYGYNGQKGWTSKAEHPLTFPATDHFVTQMDAFSKAILDKQPFEPSGVEGLRDLLVVEAIYRSIASGKAEKVAKT